MFIDILFQITNLLDVLLGMKRTFSVNHIQGAIYNKLYIWSAHTHCLNTELKEPTFTFCGVCGNIMGLHSWQIAMRFFKLSLLLLYKYRFLSSYNFRFCSSDDH